MYWSNGRHDKNKGTNESALDKRKLLTHCHTDAVFLFSCQPFVAEKNINNVAGVVYILNLAFLHLVTRFYYV